MMRRLEAATNFFLLVSAQRMPSGRSILPLCHTVDMQKSAAASYATTTMPKSRLYRAAPTPPSCNRNRPCAHDASGMRPQHIMSGIYEQERRRCRAGAPLKRLPKSDACARASPSPHSTPQQRAKREKMFCLPARQEDVRQRACAKRRKSRHRAARPLLRAATRFPARSASPRSRRRRVSCRRALSEAASGWSRSLAHKKSLEQFRRSTYLPAHRQPQPISAKPRADTLLAPSGRAR